MSIEQAIHGLVTGDAGVSAIIGDGLYPVMLPQGAPLPAIVYSLSDAPQQTTVDGPLGLTDARYQFSCWAKTHAAVVELSEALVSLLDFYSGTVEGVVIQGTQIMGRRDVPAVDVETEQLSRYGRLVDCIISFNES